MATQKNRLASKGYVKKARRTKAMQEAADLQAQKDGYFCASYIGRYSNTFVYAGRYIDTIPRMMSLPHIIFYHGGECWSSQRGIFSILKGMTWYKHDAGRKLFRAIKERFDRYENLTDNEKTLVFVHRGQKDHPIDIEVVYDYLEIAERMGKQVEPVLGDSVCPYYLKIV